MKKLACILLLALSTVSIADDVKWEYAEMSSRTVPGRPALKDKEGNERAAVPDTITIKWVSGSEEFEVKNWGEMAEKLKAPFMAEPSEAGKRIRVLNMLGNQGWELVDQQVVNPTFTGAGAVGGPVGRPGTTTSMLFKRRRA